MGGDEMGGSLDGGDLLVDVQNPSFVSRRFGPLVIF